MGFKIPKELEMHLNTEWRVPPSSFVDFSTYYAGLDTYFMQYMRTVIRPCLAYSTGVVDGLSSNRGVRMNIGQTLKRAAVRLIKGEKYILEGDDTDCNIISMWAQSTGFDKFLEAAIDYTLDGRACIKLNKDRRGRCIPTATRIDRAYLTTDETGEVVYMLAFNTFLASMRYGNKDRSYWLVEERFYRNNRPYVRYKVHWKSGTSQSDILPTFTTNGIPYKALPENVRMIIDARGIRVNEELPLPFRDGLGVWAMLPTATNSCVPGIAIGDPLLFGALDILFATDCVFSGTITDVILGKGKILVPRRFLKQVADELKAVGVKSSVSERFGWTDAGSDNDDTLVYLQTERDQDFNPTSVQFDIRADQYKGMLEIYLQQLVSHCGFSPTSVFPFLADGSTKTATEVSAEENLTRSTVQSMHQIIEPVLNRVLDEVLYQFYKDIGQGYDRNVKIRLSDYIGNPLLRDQNTRENYAAGLIPQDVAVQRINGTSDRETAEYVEKINTEIEKREAANPFPDFNLDSEGAFDFDIKDGGADAENTEGGTGQA